VFFADGFAVDLDLFKASTGRLVLSRYWVGIDERSDRCRVVAVRHTALRLLTFEESSGLFAEVIGIIDGSMSR